MANQIETHTKVLASASHLLEYPDMQWWNGLTAYRAVLDELGRRQEQQMFGEFFDYLEQTGQKSYEEQYVRSFDFSQNTNLYLTTMERTDFGKQSEEMHRYKNLFLSHGYDVDNQLPDYLPALLELAAALPEKEASEVLNAIKPRVELLRKRFIEAKLVQVFLLDIVLTETAALGGEAA